LPYTSVVRWEKKERTPEGGPGGVPGKRGDSLFLGWQKNKRDTGIRDRMTELKGVYICGLRTLGRGGREKTIRE